MFLIVVDGRLNGLVQMSGDWLVLTRGDMSLVSGEETLPFIRRVVCGLLLLWKDDLKLSVAESFSWLRT